jgi:hypothetical protein
VAIRLRRPTQPDLIQRKLFTVHNHAYASPEYVQENGLPKSARRAGQAQDSGIWPRAQLSGRPELAGALAERPVIRAHPPSASTRSMACAVRSSPASALPCCLTTSSATNPRSSGCRLMRKARPSTPILCIRRRCETPRESQFSAILWFQKRASGNFDLHVNCLIGLPNFASSARHAATSWRLCRIQLLHKVSGLWDALGVSGCYSLSSIEAGSRTAASRARGNMA